MNVNEHIVNYINNNIMIQYAKLDCAHDEKHIRYVIERSLLLAELFEANADMCYVVAAFHDLGMKYGRDKHEKRSAEILDSDQFLKEFFEKWEMDLMRAAILEHRSSYGGLYTSIYSKILSQADRSFDLNLMIERSILYGLANYPTYNYQQHLQRTYDYLIKKYGKMGRVYMVLDYEPDKTKQKEIYKLLDSKEEFEKLFSIIFNKYVSG